MGMLDTKVSKILHATLPSLFIKVRLPRRSKFAMIQKNAAHPKTNAVCEMRNEHRDAGYYFTAPPSGSFRPGIAFLPSECKAVQPSNCTQYKVNSANPRGSRPYPSCILIKNDKNVEECISPYIPCTSNAESQSNADAGLLNSFKASQANTACLKDRNGVYRLPLLEDLHLAYIFYILGVTISLFGAVGFMCLMPFSMTK